MSIKEKLLKNSLFGLVLVMRKLANDEYIKSKFPNGDFHIALEEAEEILGLESGCEDGTCKWW